jgi:hypothetical protein
MMQINESGNAARKVPEFNVYIKSGGNGFSQIVKYVIGISILLGLLMLTIR